MRAEDTVQPTGPTLVSEWPDHYSAHMITPNSLVVAIYPYSPRLVDELQLKPPDAVKILSVSFVRNCQILFLTVAVPVVGNRFTMTAGPRDWYGSTTEDHESVHSPSSVLPRRLPVSAGTSKIPSAVSV